MKTFYRMLKFVKPYWKILVGGFIAALIYVLLNQASIWFSASFIKVIFQDQQQQKVEKVKDVKGQDKQSKSISDSKNNSPINKIPGSEDVENLNTRIKNYVKNIIQKDTPKETLKFLCFLLFFIFFFKNIFRFLKSLSIKFVQLRLITDIRDHIYSHLHKLSLSFYSENRLGEIQSIVQRDVSKLRRALTVVFNRAIVGSLNIIAGITLLFLISWKLTLIAFIILPVTVYIMGIIGKIIKRRSVKNSEQIAGVMSILNETLKGIRIVKAFAMEEFEKNKFFRETKKFFKLMFKTDRLDALSSPLNEVVGVAVGIALLWIGGTAVLAGNGLAPEDFMRFLMLLFNMMNPLKRLNKVNILTQRGIASGERIFTILDAEPDITEKEDAIELQNFEDKIEYNQITFSYNKEEGPVLKDIDITAPKGEVVAFVGESGAGKTTLVDLLPRFYDPNSGAITIDGIDIRDYTLDSLRQKIGIVTQETILFNDNVRNNIAYGIDDVDQDALEEAAEAANAMEFIEDLEKGFDTNIGDNGVKLSGGQRQRLTIARALLKNPPILILDEATSSLDTEAEQKVQKAIDSLMQHRTVFVIAHRLSTITGADKILVMDDGEIVERGTHEELLDDEDSLYSYYFNLQFEA